MKQKTLWKGGQPWKYFLIFPKSKQAQQELGQELAKFQSEQVLKTVQKLPCSTEQKLELVDAAVKHLKEQQ